MKKRWRSISRYTYGHPEQALHNQRSPGGLTGGAAGISGLTLGITGVALGIGDGGPRFTGGPLGTTGVALGITREVVELGGKLVEATDVAVVTGGDVVVVTGV